MVKTGALFLFLTISGGKKLQKAEHSIQPGFFLIERFPEYLVEM